MVCEPLHGECPERNRGDWHWCTCYSGIRPSWQIGRSEQISPHIRTRIARSVFKQHGTVPGTFLWDVWVPYVLATSMWFSFTLGHIILLHFRHLILLHALLATLWLFSFALGHLILFHSWSPYSPLLLATLFSFTLDHPILLRSWPPFSSFLGHPILLPPLPPNSIAVAVIVDARTPHSSTIGTIGNRQIDKQANVWQMISHLRGNLLTLTVNKYWVFWKSYKIVTNNCACIGMY